VSGPKHTPDASEGIAPTGECNWCSREARLRQVLDATVEGVYYRWGYYLCRWHQAVETRRRNRDRARAALREAGVS
jgi:hypothetical protein